MIDVAGLFWESYLADLEDTIEDMHLHFDVSSYGVASSSLDVMRAHLEPLILSPPLHLSQFDIGLEILEEHLEDSSLSLDHVLHPFPLGFGLSHSLA